SSRSLAPVCRPMSAFSPLRYSSSSLKSCVASAVCARVACQGSGDAGSDAPPPGVVLAGDGKEGGALAGGGKARGGAQSSSALRGFTRVGCHASGSGSLSGSVGLPGVQATPLFGPLMIVPSPPEAPPGGPTASSCARYGARASVVLVSARRRL